HQSWRRPWPVAERCLRLRSELFLYDIIKMNAGIFRFDHILNRGRLHAPYGPARPVVLRLAAAAAALKDASRRASARWPRKNEAILDRGGARCLGMFRPGRENGTPAQPENVDCGAGWRTLQRPRTARIFTSSCRLAQQFSLLKID